MCSYSFDEREIAFFFSYEVLITCVLRGLYYIPSHFSITHITFSIQEAVLLLW